jgi:hypothetical protein
MKSAKEIREMQSELLPTFTEKQKAKMDKELSRILRKLEVFARKNPDKTEFTEILKFHLDQYAFDELNKLGYYVSNLGLYGRLYRFDWRLYKE